MDTNILTSIGFTGGEIRVYFALLELGNTTTGPLILKSNVSRSKVYEILERLKQKGLVTESIHENTKYFESTSPERILDFIQTKEDELDRDKEAFKTFLPELIAKQKLTEDKQEVKIYVGFEGIKTLYKEILNQLGEGDEYLAMTFSDESLDNKSISLLFNKFHQRRAMKKATAKIIAHESDTITQHKMDYSNTGGYEFRVTELRTPTGHVIYKDSVAIFNWGKVPRAFVIISKDNAEHYRRFFYDVWAKAKPLKN